jgi:hypothetical protein
LEVKYFSTELLNDQSHCKALFSSWIIFLESSLAALSRGELSLHFFHPEVPAQRYAPPKLLFNSEAASSRKMDSESDSDFDPFHHPLGRLLWRANHHPFGLFPIDDHEERSESSDEDGFSDILQRVRQNDRDTTELQGDGSHERIQNMTDEEWEELGRTICNNTHLKELDLRHGAHNDHKMTFLFRGLTRSSSIKDMMLRDNELSVAGVQSMVPFLQNSNNLRELDLDGNNIQSEGFNVLFQALGNSPIEELSCSNCGIESIEIESDHIPQNLIFLNLEGNRISADGCRELATLLQGGNSTLTDLWLDNNKIDDEGVVMLVNALQSNTSLDTLDLRVNDDISTEGRIMLLKLVNDISSIKATLQSNHTLRRLHVTEFDCEIQKHIDMAIDINRNYESNPEAAGREKVICTHLKSENRALLCHLQEVDHSVYSEIDSLHLPEVLSLIGRSHGQGELYAAVSSSIMTLFSTVNRKKCIQQERAYHAAIAAEHITKVEELNAELAAIEAVEGNIGNDEMDNRSNKRRLTWWWGLLGYGSE